MAATPEMRSAAKRAAVKVAAYLIEMMEAGESGEVAVIVGYHGLDPEKRVTTKGKTIKVARGQMTELVRLP